MRERYATRVGLLRCFRGIETVTAMTILAELFSFERSDTAKKLMGYLGLTPSEHTSGVVRRGQRPLPLTTLEGLAGRTTSARSGATHDGPNVAGSTRC